MLDPQDCGFRTMSADSAPPAGRARSERASAFRDADPWRLLRRPRGAGSPPPTPRGGDPPPRGEWTSRRLVRLGIEQAWSEEYNPAKSQCSQR
jgi:hypothetical protein